MECREWEDLAKAFTIFNKYSTGDPGESISAEHGVIYSGPNPETVSEKDLKALEELGWGIKTEFSCFRYFT